jgi:hypothetical protein
MDVAARPENLLSRKRRATITANPNSSQELLFWVDPISTWAMSCGTHSPAADTVVDAFANFFYQARLWVSDKK